MSTLPTVYLAGPITGLTYGESNDWRLYAAKKLAAIGIKGVSPLRAKEYLESLGKLSGHGAEYSHLGVFSSPQAVLTRDYGDVAMTDGTIVNLLGAKVVSVGTVAEIAWAWQLRKRLVVAIEPEGNPHNHMFITEMIRPFRVETLDGAIDVMKAILL